MARGGRQERLVDVVSALAAAAGALVVGLLLLVWVGTPSWKSAGDGGDGWSASRAAALANRR